MLSRNLVCIKIKGNEFMMNNMVSVKRGLAMHQQYLVCMVQDVLWSRNNILSSKFGWQFGWWLWWNDIIWFPSRIIFLCFSGVTMVSYLAPKTKSFGNFIISTDDVTDDDLVIFYLDLGCKGRIMQFEDVLRNMKQKSATAELSYMSFGLAIKKFSHCQNLHLIN